MITPENQHPDDTDAIQEALASAIFDFLAGKRTTDTAILQAIYDEDMARRAREDKP